MPGAELAGCTKRAIQHRNRADAAQVADAQCWAPSLRGAQNEQSR
jgi:hypothetical protein